MRNRERSRGGAGRGWVWVERASIPRYASIDSRDEAERGRGAPRVLVCHDWFTTLGGADLVAARLAVTCRADTVASFCVNPDLLDQLGIDAPVLQWSWGRWFNRGRRWPLALPLMGAAWRRLPTQADDCVITSAHTRVNSLRARSGTVISYCHTPLRFAWSWHIERRRLPRPLRPALRPVAALARFVDRCSARHVDHWIVNSAFVAERVHAAYGRPSTVIHPPIDTDYWTPAPIAPGDADDGALPPELAGRDFFLASGRLVAYKRVDLVVEAARAAGVTLVVAGSGPLARRLATSDRVLMIEQPDRATLRELYRCATAVVHGGVEDFGMSMVEAMACGTPVIAVDAGGARETVVPGRSGVLTAFGSDAEIVAGLSAAMRDFDADALPATTLREHALAFSAERFDREILAFLAEVRPDLFSSDGRQS